MEQQRRQQLQQDALRKLSKNRNDIYRSVTVYGDQVYDAFERMLKISTLTAGPYQVAKIIVLIGRTSESAICYIEGVDPKTGEKVADLADGYHDTEEVSFNEEAAMIGSDLDYTDFDEIEAAWEIIYYKVFPKAIKTEILYDYKSPYTMETGDTQGIEEAEQTSAIIVWW